MFISHADKVLFIAVPRTGSTSMDSLLNGKRRKHPLPPEYHKTLEEVIRDKPDLYDYTKAAFVRNPWDRFVSLYYEFQKRGYELAPFYDFCVEFCSGEHELCHDRHWWPQYNYVTINGWVSVDILGRFENYAHDAEMICGKPPKWRHKPTTHPPYRELYDPETRDLVYEYYLQDVLTFHYEF